MEVEFWLSLALAGWVCLTIFGSVFIFTSSCDIFFECFKWYIFWFLYLHGVTNFSKTDISFIELKLLNKWLYIYFISINHIECKSGGAIPYRKLFLPSCSKQVFKAKKELCPQIHIKFKFALHSKEVSCENVTLLWLSGGGLWNGLNSDLSEQLYGNTINFLIFYVNTYSYNLM